MLKIAGWLITAQDVESWRKAHPQLPPRNSPATVRSNVVAVLRRHPAPKKIPFKEENVIQITYPKMTPTERGHSMCILVRRAQYVKNEDWRNINLIPMKEFEDEAMRKQLEADGLALGEWLTVPDPFEEDWPFLKRHPGARCPPEA